MDKDLLQQYKYLDTPQVRDKESTKEQQAINKHMANWMFNFLNE